MSLIGGEIALTGLAALCSACLFIPSLLAVVFSHPRRYLVFVFNLLAVVGGIRFPNPPTVIASLFVWEMLSIYAAGFRK